VAAVDKFATALLIEHAEKFALPPARIFSTCFGGWVLMSRGEVEEGYALLRPALGSSREGSTVVRLASIALAGAFVYSGFTSMVRRVDIIEDALPLISDVLGRCPQGRACWSTAELLRVNGEFMLIAGGARAGEIAEKRFMESLSIAGTNGARSWELRTAMSLAQLWRTQSRGHEARAVLYEAYRTFDEGFDTADLCAARNLLEEMDSVAH
jgi:predicted ATPase